MKSFAKFLTLVVLALLSQFALATGTCNGDDQTHLFTHNHLFAEAIHKCSSFSGLNTKCFNKEYPGMTPGCVDCYKHLAQCGINNCKRACFLSTKSDGCHECSKSHCAAIVEECAGISFSDSPDIART